MEVGAIETVSCKPKRPSAVWRVETSAGLRCLKLSHKPHDRAVFSAGAQEHLSERGARVPRLYRTRSGSRFAVVDGRTLHLSDWIDLTPAARDLHGASALCGGLGEFHARSPGYTPPKGAVFHTRLATWPQAYARVRRNVYKLAAKFQALAARKPLLRTLTDRLCRQADAAIERLQGSAYQRLAARGESAWGLAHRDPNWTNAQLGPGGVWLVDLDSVVFDLPITDMRIFISETMEQRGRWDHFWVEAMLSSYEQAQVLAPDLRELLLIELSLPVQCYKWVNKYLRKTGSKARDEELRRILACDDSRWEALRALGLKEP